MSRGERLAKVVWQGSLSEGSGELVSVSSGAFAGLPISWSARVEESAGRTSPEELIAAAHASCYAMALSHTLAGKGMSPQRLEITATCSLELGESGLAITDLALAVRGHVIGLEQEAFEQIAREAERSCPVSNALRGNVEIRVDARLA